MESSPKKVKSNPITNRQKEIMTEFISARREMICGKLTKTYTKEKMKRVWAELAILLNSVPDGPAKEWQQWRKTWVDLKKNTKAKLAENKKNVTGTGGGPHIEDPINPIEDKLLEIITAVAIEGDCKILESDVSFDFGDNFDKENEEIVDNEEIMDIEEQVEDSALPSTWGDHNYYNQTEEFKQVKGKHPFNNRKRSSKATRLGQSLRNNNNLLNISRQRLLIEQNFYEKKLEIMREEVDIKQRKLQIMERGVEALQQIAEDNRRMREMYGTP